jgi:Tfp pilus assembly protein PilF
MVMFDALRNGNAPRWSTLAFGAALAVAVGAGCSHKTVDDYLHSGDQAMQSTHLAEAEVDYQNAAKQAPNDARPHVALGKLYVFEQKPGAAAAEFMKVIELEPNNATAHEELASIYVTQSQLGLAEAQDRAAVALSPANSDYRMNLGTILQKQGKAREAEAEFRTAIGLQPKNAHAHLALANLLNAAPDRRSEAQAEYAEVRALDSSLLANNAAPATAAAPGASATTVVASANTAGGAPKIRDLNKRFLLTHDSPVYESADNGSRVVAQVHRRKWVHVTGISGPWLRIQLKNGTVGFIPVTAAE